MSGQQVEHDFTKDFNDCDPNMINEIKLQHQHTFDPKSLNFLDLNETV